MKIQKGYIVGLICALAVVVGGTVLLLHITNKEQATFDAKKALETVNPNDAIDDFLELEKIVIDSMKQYGTHAGFEVINEGERQGLINNDACHGLLHYVGHSAYSDNPTDFDALLSAVEQASCIGGYLHGIEAEIVLASSNAVADVQDFCAFQRQRNVNPGACYHGVGHAATELYNYDVSQALALCDALEGGPEEDLSNCYRGIFSEIGNVVVGYDGHTGLEAEKLDIPGLDPQNPYKFCEQLETKYQSSCKSQFTKIVMYGVEMERWAEQCAKPDLDESTTNICLSSSSAVYARHHLSFADTTTLPDFIFTLPFKQQQVVILGSAEGFAGYFYDNVDKDWESFCASIPVDQTRAYCTEVFTRTVVHNEAPWMERTDIR